MSHDFFYCHTSTIVGESIRLENEEAKHLVRVLRKQVGDHVWITDGVGTAYEAIVKDIGKKSVLCVVIAVHEHFNESTIQVTLAISLLKNPSRMDWIFEKGTELGVRRFIPLTTTRTIAHAEKAERWKHIALSATKQSCRSVIPDINPVMSFETLIHQNVPYDLRLIPHEQADDARFISDALHSRPRPTSALIVIGPEGGFTVEEMNMAEEHGFVPVSLGPRRLRSETAAIVAISHIISR
jgi:16S rRNA (uracil1498-N3)-methyltransferase